MGARCCAPGQRLEAGACGGAPLSCPQGFHRRPDGCVLTEQRLQYAGGALQLGPDDWEASGLVPTEDGRVAPFALDRAEVTFERWARCVDARACRRLPKQEPGLPVIDVTPQDAEQLCRFEGGRLPTRVEWLFAALGTVRRRFPWGMTGLVCRRATYGLVDGPCAQGGSLPDWAGARLDGMSPEGAFDLAGNVAEWVKRADGYEARGGSFRSRSAAELKTWATESVKGAWPHVGFRCAYPAPAERDKAGTPSR